MNTATESEKNASAPEVPHPKTKRAPAKAPLGVRSLWVRYATRAAIAGASERSIMNQTAHRSVQMVRRYIRDGSLFRENSAGKLGR